jgi:hypothetical protein
MPATGVAVSSAWSHKVSLIKNGLGVLYWLYSDAPASRPLSGGQWSLVPVLFKLFGS